MGYVISEKKIKKARKEYDCEACAWLHEHVEGCNRLDLQMSISEIKTYLKAKNNDFKIKIGSPYISQMISECGDVYWVKVIEEINDICCSLGLYDN